MQQQNKGDEEKKTEAEGLSMKLEGEECADWKLLDLGHTVVHFFTPEGRATYDLESLWSLE